MLFFRQVISLVAPMSDRHHRLSIAQMSRFPWRLIGPTLRSRFSIDELTLRAWFFGPPRVDPHL